MLCSLQRLPLSINRSSGQSKSASKAQVASVIPSSAGTRQEMEKDNADPPELDTLFLILPEVPPQTALEAILWRTEIR